MKNISIVIPCYCSEKFLENVVNDIFLMNKDHKEYNLDVILVDDYSSDNTFKTIKKICKNNSSVQGIKLAANSGQHNALMAGLKKAKGDIIVCMDDDGQTDPYQMYKLIDQIDKGYDVVYAKYDEKKHNAFRNFGSKINELMASYLINKPKDLYVSSYFAAKRFVIDEILKYDYPYTYIIGLILRTTQNITNVNIKHKERIVGSSGYSIKKLFGLWMNGFTAFSVKPLRIATIFGLGCSCIGILIIIYLFFNKIMNPNVPIGWTSLASLILLIGGALMMMLGLIGEYIGRIYVCINKSPQYVISKLTEEINEQD